MYVYIYIVSDGRVYGLGFGSTVSSMMSFSVNCRVGVLLHIFKQHCTNCRAAVAD